MHLDNYTKFLYVFVSFLVIIFTSTLYIPFSLSLSPSANSHLLLSPSIVTHKPEVAGHLCSVSH